MTFSGGAGGGGAASGAGGAAGAEGAAGSGGAAGEEEKDEITSGLNSFTKRSDRTTDLRKSRRRYTEDMRTTLFQAWYFQGELEEEEQHQEQEEQQEQKGQQAQEEQQEHNQITSGLKSFKKHC